MTNDFLPTTALWHKAWRESRTRFLLGAAVIAALCAIFILFQAPMRQQLADAATPSDTFVEHVYRRIYAGFVRGLFLIISLILGLGGLQREQAHGTVAFTLSLPCSRQQLVCARAVVGLAEVCGLALLPALLIPCLSALSGTSYPTSQSVAFAGLWIVVGWALFAFAFLLSSAIRNEFAALTVALLAFYVYPLVVVYAPWLQGLPVHIHYLMNGTGMPYFDASTSRFVGPFPWRIAAGVSAVTLGLMLAAARSTVRRDFA